MDGYFASDDAYYIDCVIRAIGQIPMGNGLLTEGDLNNNLSEP